MGTYLPVRCVGGAFYLPVTPDDSLSHQREDQGSAACIGWCTKKKPMGDFEPPGTRYVQSL